MVLGSHQARNLPAGTKGRVALDVEGQKKLARWFMEIVERHQPPLLPQEIMELLREEYRATMEELRGSAPG